MYKVLIVGGNFSNKGAQSMLFTTAAECMENIPGCEVYFGCNGEIYDENCYKFKRLYYTTETQNSALADSLVNSKIIIRICKDFIKSFIGKTKNPLECLERVKIINSIDLILDISGYELADFVSEYEHEYYLNNIRIAKKNNIPIVLLPQSFGPFEYSQEKRYLKEQIADLLTYPKLIFAREKEGFDYLNSIGAKNVFRSFDLVLQSKGNKFNLICNNKPKEILHLDTTGNVAIIPNYHCFEGGNEKYILNLYQSIITLLLENGKNVYIFRHSSFDLNDCRKIKDCFKFDNRVNLIDREFDCTEFDSFIKQFEFVVCSRYHGCVHAYRNNVPCIILGWAVKYKELADSLKQSEYVFDVIGDCSSKEDILFSVNRMLCNLNVEKDIIKKCLDFIQQNNCFDIVFNSLGFGKSDVD